MIHPAHAGGSDTIEPLGESLTSRYEVIYEAVVEVKRFWVQTSPVTPKRLSFAIALLFAL